MRRVLERNPVGWLERRTWYGRILTWLWFGGVITFYSLMLVEDAYLRGPMGQTAETWIGALLAISLAATSAASFRRERETGVMELLLVTPQRPE